jgi:transposase
MEEDLNTQLDAARRHERTLRIAEQYLAGVPVSKIGDMFGVSRNTIFRIAKMYNLARPRSPEGRHEMIRDLLRLDWTQEAISVYLGVSVSLVSQIGKAAGLSRYRSVYDHKQPNVESA